MLDQCHEVGVPEILFEYLKGEKQEKKQNFKREKKPDYYVEDGKRKQLDFDIAESLYRLTEESIVVVSDSIYCSVDNHEIKEEAVIIEVREKRHGSQLYLFSLGYCAQCQKFYMDIDDFKALNSYGRAKVSLIFETDESDFQVTSGEEFNREKQHLDDLEKKISDEIVDIRQSPDYVNPYAVGGYDDGSLAFSKERSNRKYGPRLDELQGYVDIPYSYRVDISNGDDVEIYYVGAADVEVGGKKLVLSANSDFGHNLVNYQNTKVRKDGREYGIQLTRQFDIVKAELFGYTNLRTDEDLIFQRGITDPFLIRVLRMRKRQHNITDIFVTIQENQNKIVNTAFESNLIVQGCAGSGKTMVLLHRLSALKYKRGDYDFNHNALILTPNERFSLHIQGLAEGLQIGSIARISVEEYYIAQLIEYDSAFKPDRKLAAEQNVQQDFVDYIYSDEFKREFDIAYDKIIAERNSLIEKSYKLSDAMGQPRHIVASSPNARMIEQLKYAVDAIAFPVNEQNKVIKGAELLLKRLEDRRVSLEKKMASAITFSASIVQETLPRVNSKIGTYLSEQEQAIGQIEQQIEVLNQEREKAWKSIMPGRKTRVEKIRKQISDVTKTKKEAQQIYEESYKILEEPQINKSDEKVLDWMSRVMTYIPSVSEDINLCKNVKGEYTSYEIEYEQVKKQIQDAQFDLEEKKSKTYSLEIKQSIQEMYDAIEKYELPNIFWLIFELAVSKYMEENEVREPQGKYYRYILYAELLFAMKYFGEVHGTTGFLCVDEGQDLALNEYRLIHDLNGSNMIMNIFGDTNQLIKPGRGISEWDTLKEYLQARQFELNENYRNTNQITRFCNNSFNMHVLQTGVDGAEVREIPRKELEHEISSMEFNTERVAVIVPRSVIKSSYIKQEDIPDERKSLIGDKIGNGYISIVYVDEVKGIEFDRVFVITNNLTKNEKYIAYTRALSELILVVDETIKGLDDRAKKKRKAKSGGTNIYHSNGEVSNKSEQVYNEDGA